MTGDEARSIGFDRAMAQQPHSFTSKLTDPRERFLAAVVDHAIACGRRTAADFLRAFPPRAIMAALAEQPQLRAKLLIATTGQDERIATKKSPQSAGEDLELAVGEGVAKEEAVVALFEPDDRVRYLDHGRLWAFVTEGNFWRETTAETPANVALEHIAFILVRARAEKLLTARDVIEGLGVEGLLEALPKEDVVRLLATALADGIDRKPFDDERALHVLGISRLLEHVGLAVVWERVIAKKLSHGAVTDDGQRVSVDLVVDDDVLVKDVEIEKAPSINVPGVAKAGAVLVETGALDVDVLSKDINDRITVVEDTPAKTARR